MNLDQYCLRWNDHRSILLSNFERLLENSTSVDCTLAAEGQFLRAHKVVLSACSPYFELLLNQDKEKHPIIFMKDMKFQELKAIMIYMYRGEVVIPHDQLTALLQAAESLQIKGLGCGDKEPPEKVNKGLSQQRQMVQQPQILQQPQKVHQPQMVQQTKQTTRQHPSARTPEPTRESGPQFVDLTEEMVHSNAAKRTTPQTPGRNKRVAYSPGNVLLQPQSVAPAASTSQMNILRTSLPAQNLPSTSINPSVVSLSVSKPVTAVKRPGNETSGGSMYIASQVTPTKRPELKDKRDPGKQAVAYKANSKASLPPTQKRFSLGDVPPGQNPSQSSVAHDTNYIPLPSSEKNDLKSTLANDFVRDVQQSEPTSSASIAGFCPSDVQARKATEDNSEVGEIGPNINSPLSESASEQAKESDLENSEKKKETLAAGGDKSFNKPGPSGSGKTGRRRRGTAERRYSCPECGKKFSVKGYLDQHLRLHDGDTYQCDVCDKTFLSRPALIRHVRLHSAKPAPPVQHKCKLCGASFTNPAELEQHLTEHTLAVENENKE